MAKDKKKEEPVLTSFGGKFVFEDCRFRKLRNGNKIRVILELDFDEEAYGVLGKLLEKHVDVELREFIPEPVLDEDEKKQKKLFEDGVGPEA
jgi:hypothetical protein